MRTRFTNLWILAVAWLFAAAGAWAQSAVSVGAQVTAEGDIVSGKAYILKTGADRYITDNGTDYDVPNTANSATEASVYYLISNGDGTWKIKNYYTGKYWGIPVYNTALAPAEEASAGAWTLKFSGGIAYPTAPDASSTERGIDRSNGKVWAHNTGTNNNHKVYIYKIAPSTTALAELADNDVIVSSEAAASLTTGQWYTMFDRGANHGYLYENTSTGTLYNTNTVPGTEISATANAKYLVRLVSADDGKYYVQTGFGNYFDKFAGSTAVPTTGTDYEQITIEKIASTDGHFYLQSSSSSVILDANITTSGDATVVGWGTTVPSSTGGNNDWAFYPVTLLTSSISPLAISKVYTINNTNTSRGAMTYDPTKSTKYVYSSGKQYATAFDATSDNCRWVFIPTGAEGQYYLYNVGADKFAIPSSTSSTASWVFSHDAVAVQLIPQSDGTYKIKTATTNTYAAVSNGYEGPIINYNDVGGNFTITLVDGADESTAANAAVARLVDTQTALTAVNEIGDGFYVVRIKTHGTYADKYVYPEDITYNSTNYALSFDHAFNTRPAIDNTAYYTHMKLENNMFYWQLPDGRYLYGSGNKFPIPSSTQQTCSTDYSSGFRFWGSSRYAVPYLLSSKYFIGETESSGNAYYDVYPINLTAAGLVAWQVNIESSGDTIYNMSLSCTRSDVSGLTSVYTNGYFFLPTGVTPTDADFSMDGMLSCTIDATEHTITVEYDASICVLADNVSVIQGNQTTGIGNTMQALLRLQVTPFKACTPTRVSLTLTGYDQLDSVAVYTTTDDEIHAASASPVKIGEAAVSGSSVTVTTSSATALTAGTPIYIWITGDVKSTATEWGTIDAAITSLAYTSTDGDNALDLSTAGDPDGVMRIYKQQTFLWTPSNTAGVFYRIPTMIATDDGGVVALTDYRYDHPYDLGKNASNGAGTHVIDVVSRRSTDGGLTWQSPVTVAKGDGSTDAGYGYGDPAIVKDADGTLHCMMAAGNTSYANGMLHMGYSKSTDGGASWSAVTDIYSSINKNSLDITSAFTTAGTGVTFSNGRMAFAMLGKVSGTTNIYPLYSDDNGASWIVSPNVAYAGGDESKFEIMNDNSLLLSVRKGNYNGTANRAHNRTTGDASDSGIDTWGTAAEWTDMNANACNADIIYYNRSTDDATLPDVMLHTLTKSYGTTGVYRQDLRLYMSVDEGASWSEIFQLQPGSAAYSSMLKLPNGDLAVIFEDGSIGNRDHQDNYAINYVVISKELLVSRFVEVAESSEDIKVVYGTTGEETYGSWSGLTWTSNATSGLAGVTMTLSDGAHNKFSNWNSRYNLAYHPATADTDATITLTVPSPYVISGYSFKASKSSTSDYTVTVTPAGSSATTVGYASNLSGYTNIAVTDVNASSTTFTVNSTNVSYWLNFADFTITVSLPNRTVNFQNTASSAVTATITVPAGTTPADCIDAHPQGNLSPLVTYGDVSYDFSTNIYTVPYTVQTPSVASPTWYYARLRNTKFMSYDPIAETLSGYGHPVSSQMTTFGDEYLWAIVGDPYDCVKIYNKVVGTTQPLATITQENNEKLHFASNDTTTFQPYYFDSGLVFRLNGQTAYLNDVNGGIGRWNSGWGADDAGSKMFLTAEADVEELSSYVPDAVTNYVSRYLSGNIIGAVGDFTSAQAQANVQGLYQTAVAEGSSVSVADYKFLLTTLRGFVKPLTTGNYRLVNASTGKYLGFNEAFGVRGYTDANGTNADEGYTVMGQTLSTIWHIDVTNAGTAAAPVVTNAGYYLDAVTSLSGASAGSLVLSGYPLTYALGVNEGGALYSSGDNIGAAAAGSYAAAAARWSLVPASTADITITGNVLSGKSYATLYVPFDCTINTVNTKAFTLVQENVDDDKAQAYLSELATYGEVIPAGTPVVIINSDAETSLAFTPCNNNTATAPTDNVICGTYKKVLFDSDAERNRTNTLIFGRSKSTGMAGFYYPSSSVTKLNANRCYLIAPASGNAIGFALFFDDEESPVTGVNALENGVVAPAAVYDLQGRRVAVPQKGGVYIVNGRKVMR